MSQTELSFCLVGFGKHELKDMLEWVGTDKEEDLVMASQKWPPRYRKLESCSEDEQLNFIQYVEFLSGFMKKQEELRRM